MSDFVMGNKADKAEKADHARQDKPVIAVIATACGNFRFVVDADEMRALQSSADNKLEPEPANLM